MNAVRQFELVAFPARFESVLHENPQLFASKYMQYLPSEEELVHEIEQQRLLLIEKDNPPCNP